MTKLIFLFLWISSALIQADTLSQAYQDGHQIATSHANQSIDLLKTLDLSLFPGYQENLPQQNYYGGVTQQSTTLASDAAKSVNNDEAGKTVGDSFSHRPFYQINANSESMQRLHQIAEHGDEIMHGSNTDKTTCSLKPKECHYTWQEKTCLSSKTLGTFSCTRALQIEFSPYKTDSYRLSLHRGRSESPFTINVNLSQPDTCQQGSAPCYTIYKDLIQAPGIQLPTDCAMAKVVIQDPQGYVLVENTATCANPSVSLNVGTCLHGSCTVPYFHDVSMTVEIYQGKEYWDGTCMTLQNQEKEGLCHLTKPAICIEPAETRIIGDVPYARECWKERAVYECGGSAENTCDDLIKQGCEQSTSSCIQQQGSRCVTYQQVYQCPINQCTEDELLCGEQAFCLEGNCSSHDYSPADDLDFKKGIASLSAASEASKDFDGKGKFIFKGQMLECSRDFAGAKNCCRDKGWGLDLNLMHCNDTEKKLGKAKENRLVVATGEYCAKRKKFPGGSICLSHHQTYCVFQSKLARIIQEQGRRNQLGIGFGSGKNSNCLGITPEQMQLIKFESIDFSEFYQEIQQKQRQPDYQQTAAGISQRVKDFYNQGDING